MGVGSHELIINDDNYRDHIETVVDGNLMKTGYVPRDFSVQPPVYGAGAYDAVDLPLIDESEWEPRIKEMEETKSRLSDIRKVGANGGLIDALDQNGQGYCWAYSTGMSIMLLRASMNLPYARLSPHAVAWKIKGGRDQGGWGALSMEFAVTNGYPTEQFWPQKSMSRANDNPKTWEDAKQYQVTQGWWDLSQTVYNRNLTFKQMMTLLLLRIPVVIDLNWWGHSVCAVDPVMIEKGSYGPRILNSWTNKWGDRGEAVLQGRKGIPDGAVAPRVVDAAA